MKLAIWLLAAAASAPFVDTDEQPACRARCAEVHAAERNACGDGFGTDECKAAADDRHQECIDRCND